MQTNLKQRKKESIHDWILRIAIALDMTNEQMEAMQEVAMKCYIKGSSDAYELYKKYRQ